MTLIRCNAREHAAPILEIMNQAIVETTSTYDYLPRTLEELTLWFEQKRLAAQPILGWMEGDRFAGYASYGSFRVKPAYKYTVEHSVYVHVDFHRRGIGRTLLKAITAEAEQAGKHVMVGCIDAANTGSIQLHLSEGFEFSGVIRHAGFKFGRWLDAAFYQKILSGPPDPRDG